MENLNPKLKGSSIIDCIPQRGLCPNFCDQCYYNENFYRSLDNPLIPINTKDKIVRVNSGHDSNINKDLVLSVTSRYKNKFYNTSIPDFEFPSPVVFTCNSRKYNQAIITSNINNIMFVRVRVVWWELNIIDYVLRAYNYKVPIVLTPMRFYDKKFIPDLFQSFYILKTHIKSDMWILKDELFSYIYNKYTKKYNCYFCGTPKSYLCKDCGNCEKLYNLKMDEGGDLRNFDKIPKWL